MTTATPATMTRNNQHVGRTVVQYDYVAGRLAIGTIIDIEECYNARLDADVDTITVRWSKIDGGVTTRHLLTNCQAIAGRSELAVLV